MSNHRITEYCDLQGTHKDHQAQLLSEWPIQMYPGKTKLSGTKYQL